MKKIIALILFFVAGLLLSFFFRNQLSSMFSPSDLFRINDTASVNRIEIISRDSIILTREGKSWLLNQTIPASSIAIGNLLFSFSRMTVKGIQDLQEISQDTAIKIRIQEGRKKHLFRFYNIHGIPYLQKEGSLKLYSVEVSGFPGIKPAEVLSADPDHWKDKILINLQSADIKMVSVNHPDEPANDFRIEIADGRYKLFDASGNEVSSEIRDTEKIDFYLSYFTNVFYDSSYDGKISPDLAPEWILKVEDQSGRVYKLEIFPLAGTNGPDMFRALIKYNDQPGFMLIRYMTLDLLLQDFRHFIRNDSK
ncbi:MAG: hypothetical protein H6540_05860 [Bacteroidales bacterium]|nr:hypothetical protein [Bacteroidales bacterium]MCB9013657.1 hypothetical protein [Bacteroidales bacterium]